MFSFSQTNVPRRDAHDSMRDAVVVTDHEIALAEHRIPLDTVQHILDRDHRLGKASGLQSIAVRARLERAQPARRIEHYVGCEYRLVKPRFQQQALMRSDAAG